MLVLLRGVNVETSEILFEALSLYSLDNPKSELIRHNENMTYKVIDSDKQYVMRIHKPIDGFSPILSNIDCTRGTLIRNELNIITALKSGAGFK
jgi:hypothetical protein